MFSSGQGSKLQIEKKRRSLPFCLIYNPGFHPTRYSGDASSFQIYNELDWRLAEVSTHTALEGQFPVCKFVNTFIMGRASIPPSIPAFFLPTQGCVAAHSWKHSDLVVKNKENNEKYFILIYTLNGYILYELPAFWFVIIFYFLKKAVWIEIRLVREVWSVFNTLLMHCRGFCW